MASTPRLVLRKTRSPSVQSVSGASCTPLRSWSELMQQKLLVRNLLGYNPKVELAVGITLHQKRHHAGRLGRNQLVINRFCRYRDA